MPKIRYNRVGTKTKLKIMEIKFEWNQDTISHFALQSAYYSKAKVLEDVTLFVENECVIEDG